MRKINFSSENTRLVFDACDYNDFCKLMFETALGQEKVSKDSANQKIREIMFSVLGVDEGCNRRALRKAIRRHKIDVYEVIEEVVENLLVSGWGDNPFFDQFVEIKSMADGDTNEFYIPDNTILTVSEVSGNHHNLIRQRIGEGTTKSVVTNWYGVKIYHEYELFMSGRVDWANFIQKIYEAFDKHVNDMVYASVMSVGDQLPASAQFNITGSLEKDKVITLAEDVQTATGDECVIMGTKSALSKLTTLSDADWISNEMKEERRTMGRLGLWEGIRLVEIPQAFAPNDTSKKLVDNNKLLFMPNSENRFVKLYNEGESQIKEVTDGQTNNDATIEYEYQAKLGVATVIGKYFGMYTITG